MSPSPNANVGGLCIKERNDPYALLGLQPDACDAWVRSAFRRASLQVHPDRCPDDPEAANRFRELTEAKDLLLNPLRRRIYDTTHGVKAKQAQAATWWVDWDSMFAELDPSDRAEAEESAPVAAAVPRPLGSSLTDEPQADILVVGATGLVGAMACLLLERGLQGRSWAIAGRDGRKLKLLESKFGRVPTYRGHVQLQNQGDIIRAVRSARVVVDLTGPSYLAGADVAEACAFAGRHYVDNTNEPAFSRMIKDKYHAQAKATGSCMVMHAGDASLIADFGTWYLARYMREKYRAQLRSVEMYEWAVGMVLSGANYLSADKGGHWPGEDTRGVDPFLLGGPRGQTLRQEDKELSKPRHQEDYGVYCLQSSMSDRLVVRATAGLLESSAPYGRKFHFNNWTPFLDLETAESHQLKSMILQKKGLQGLVDEKKIPPAGCGPNERTRRDRLDTRVFVATTDEPSPKTPPRTAHLVLSSGPGNMGDRYEGTAAMTLEAACALLDAVDKGKHRMLRPGWGTPVHHLAHLGGFMERLTARGLRLHVAEGLPPPEFLRNIVSSTLPLEF